MPFWDITSRVIFPVFSGYFLTALVLPPSQSASFEFYECVWLIIMFTSIHRHEMNMNHSIQIHRRKLKILLGYDPLRWRITTLTLSKMAAQPPFKWATNWNVPSAWKWVFMVTHPLSVIIVHTYIHIGKIVRWICIMVKTWT